MWLSNSSVGRKVVMSVTGIALVLFLTFHMAMNLVAIISADGYNMVCEFLGANWYALAATVGLAALFVIHIIYAFWLTMQNRKARGSERYAVVDKPVESFHRLFNSSRYFPRNTFEMTPYGRKKFPPVSFHLFSSSSPPPRTMV